jgi:hypothetical protein
VDAEEAAEQQRFHEAVETLLSQRGDLDGLVLTGWVLCFETAGLTDEATAHAGHIYGPRELTTWRALGLLEWCSRFSIEPGGEDE